MMTRHASLLFVVSGMVAALSASALAQDTTPSQSHRPGTGQNASPPAAPPSPTVPKTPPSSTAPAPAASTAPSTAAPPASVSAIPTDVVMVRVVGPWDADGKKGFSRVIATASGGVLNLQAQWISEDGEIVEIKELEGTAEAPELALASVRGETGAEDSTVYFDSPEDAQGFRETFVLIVGPPGEAQFGPATN